MALIARAAVVAALTFACMAAQAHRLSPGYFGLTETAPDRYAAQWKVSVSGGLADILSPQLPAVCAVAGDVRNYQLDGPEIPNEFRVQHATVVCTDALAGQEFSIAGLGSTDTDVLLHIEYLDGQQFSHRLVPSDPAVIISDNPGTFDLIGTYTVLGIEHILLGIDHLLFVFALLLIVQGLHRLVMTITAFTLAHSLTLAVATFGVITVSSVAVEATIALSIMFLALELARHPPDANPAAAASLTTRFPWVVAFCFGLLHGFGFAGALQEVGLPAQAVPLALLFFNVGVEIGQLLFIAAVLVIGFVLRAVRWTLPQRAPRFAAYVLGSVAALWVFERSLAVF
jgi:hypothetical protein